MNWVHSSISSYISTSKATVTPSNFSKSSKFVSPLLHNFCEVNNIKKLQGMNAIKSGISLELSKESHDKKV